MPSSGVSASHEEPVLPGEGSCRYFCCYCKNPQEHFVGPTHVCGLDWHKKLFLNSTRRLDVCATISGKQVIFFTEVGVSLGQIK